MKLTEIFKNDESKQSWRGTFPDIEDGQKATALIPVTSEPFNGITCDFYNYDQEEEIYMTREQIGRALGYSDPRVAITKIHDRHKDRLDKFSGVTSLVLPKGGTQNTTVYSAKGVYEVCRWSRQPKADDFMDFVWNVVEGIRKGNFKQPLDYSEIATIAAQAATQAIAAALPDIIKAVQGSQPQADTQLTRIADARLAVLPDTLTVKQVRIYLGVSNDRAYDLFHSADFPSYNIGRSLYVSKLGFIQWLSTTSKQGVFLG